MIVSASSCRRVSQGTVNVSSGERATLLESRRDDGE